jgi:hypothetical protein
MATYDDAARDWELASLGGFAYARYGGAGIFGFRLRSSSLGQNEPFLFAATGVGAGGNASGFDLNNLDGLSFSALTIQTPMSVRMLHRCPGTMVSGSVGLGRGNSAPAQLMNVGWSRLDAVREGTIFFSSSGVGVSGGSGTGAMALAGTWYSYALNGNSINPIRPWWQNAVDLAHEVAEMPGRLDRDIRRLYSGGL